MIMKNLLTTLIIFGFALVAFSQEQSKREQKGDKYYFLYDYEKAIKFYTETEQLTESGMRRLAESYQKTNRNDEAEQAYAKLVNTTNGRVPEDYYSYAALLRANGKYDESAFWMDKYQALKPDDLRVKSFNAHRNELSTLMTDPGTFKVHEQEINSHDQDFGTAFLGTDRVVFASTRAKPSLIKRKYNWNGKPYLNLYVAEVENGQLKKPKKLDKRLNGKWHDGPASFNKAGNFMAFTRNNPKDKSKDKVLELQIWFSSLDGDKWTKPEPFVYNNESYSVGHAALAGDGQTMYFVSDMPGGYGGTDIYKTTRTGNGAWSQPVNMGPGINTEGDEMFPFIEDQNQVLFFSSDGHFGLGGQDIFYVSLGGNVPGQSNVINTGSPVNTRHDDFAMIMNSTTNKGYFSSNRMGAENSDDIYGMDFFGTLKSTKRIAGLTKDQDNNLLGNVDLTLYEEDSDGDGEGAGNMIAKMRSDSEGGFSFMVEGNKNYRIVGTKEDYTDGRTLVNTFGRDSVLYADVVLTKIIKETPIEVNTDLAVAVNMNNIYFDFDMSNIRPDAARELDKIVKAMNDNPSMEVRLSSHADCRGKKAYNQDLSDQRARASLEYIKARISNPGRISGKGYGETRLVNDCSCDTGDTSGCSEDQHQLNRRTEFTVTKK
jgi:outer membrane protein OmpA-like peptidoglycan-associated protein